MVASSQARKQVLTDFRRNEIIAAALKVFGSSGFASARAEDIAIQAGIAKGTLYLYFESKEEIYAAAIQHAVQQLNERVGDRLETASGVRARVFAFITARLEFWLEQQSLYRLLLTVGREPQHRAQTNALLQATTASLIGLFEKGVLAGELEPQPFDAISWAVIDMLRGANERRLDAVATHTVDQDAQFILGLTLHFIGYPDYIG